MANMTQWLTLNDLYAKVKVIHFATHFGTLIRCSFW